MKWRTINFWLILKLEACTFELWHLFCSYSMQRVRKTFLFSKILQIVTNSTNSFWILNLPWIRKLRTPQNLLYYFSPIYWNLNCYKNSNILVVLFSFFSRYYKLNKLAKKNRTSQIFKSLQKAGFSLQTQVELGREKNFFHLFLYVIWQFTKFSRR